MLTRPCLMKVFCKGLSSPDNIHKSVFDYCSDISNKASSSPAAGLTDLNLISKLVLASLKCLKLFCIKRSSTVPGLSTSLYSFCRCPSA